jgi:hypothetical protein
MRILIVKGPGESFLRLTNILSQENHEVFEEESGRGGAQGRTLSKS